MKVVFICPPSPWLISDRDMEMLGYLYVAANVRKNGYEVQVADLAGLPEENWYIPKGDYYAITGTTPQHTHLGKIIKKLRHREPDCQIIIGGIHATNQPERCLELGADFVVVGEGEEAILEILQGKRDSGIITAPLLSDINQYPLPARDLVDSWSYQHLGTNSVMGDTPKMRESYIFTARGCPFNCAFCSQRSMWRGKVRYYSITHVIEEIKQLIKDYDIDRIYFEDDTFIIDKDRVKKLCNKLRGLRKDYKFDWHCLSRADMADEKLYETMKEAGCKQITYGTESFSDRVLKLMNKGTTGEINYEAICKAKRAGLKVRSQLIVGFPGETWKDIEITADYIKKAPADSYGVHIFIPFPGCDIWNNPAKYGVELDKNTDFSNYHTIGRRELDDVIVGDQEDIAKRKRYLIEATGNKDIAKSAERRLQYD